jgi:hypothetical protein
VQLGRDRVGIGDGPNDAHGPAAPRAHRDVDTSIRNTLIQDSRAGGRSRSCCVPQRHRDRGELVVIARQEEGKLFRFVVVSLVVGDDAGSQCMPVGEDTKIARHVERRRRDQSAQAREKGVRAHLGVSGPGFARDFEVHPHLSVSGALHGVVGKRRAQQIPADALEAVAVAAIHRDGGVQLHAEGRDGATLVASNDIDVVKAVSIAGAIPFTLVLLLQLWALVRVLRREPR